MSNFADLANVKGDDVKPPLNAPDGTYSVVITGPWKEKKAQSGNAGFDFPFKVVEPLADVDADAFAAFQAEGGFSDAPKSLVFWMSLDARYRFTDFCKALGISGDQSILEMAAELGTLGTPFQMTAKSEQGKDKNGTLLENPDGSPKMFQRWDNPAPLS